MHRNCRNSITDSRNNNFCEMNRFISKCILHGQRQLIHEQEHFSRVEINALSLLQTKMLPFGKLSEWMALHRLNDLIELNFSASMHRKTAAPTFYILSVKHKHHKYSLNILLGFTSVRSSMQIPCSTVQTMSLRMQSPETHFQFSTAAKFPRIKFYHFKCQLTVYYSLCIYYWVPVVGASLSCYLTQCILLPVARCWLNIE